MKNSKGFTLIEMMVVVAIIGILIAGVFKLVAAAGENTKRAITAARMQRLQNALAGYHAEYGTYPPVKRVRSGDPEVEDDGDGINQSRNSSSLSAANCNHAAAAQPVDFCFPNVKGLDEYVQIAYKASRLLSANETIGGQNFSATDADWNNTRIFRFGLMSYLLPRIELMGGINLVNNVGGNKMPSANFFESKQWTKNNNGWSKTKVEMRTECWTRENHACARWMPNFEGILYGGMSHFGISTGAPKEAGPRFTSGSGGQGFVTGGSSKYVLQIVSIHDGWGRNFYYYSPPPYQTYRIWSAGSNGNTFPPWVDVNSLSAGDRKRVSDWIKDDITRFDQ
ncbi:MAG: prepilin-type N-terminal cleavage/methylation domain-containing protein [Kiritimatiellae bacterium]|nr:prepilin-type N-terminal cleavage/methylation domain-containing protein [Kiritimatiellia bacterium]